MVQSRGRKIVIKDLFTEKDGVSFCPVRAAFIIGFLFIGFYTLADHKDFLEHSKDWMTGLANYLGLGGAAIAGKNYTEAP